MIALFEAHSAGLLGRKYWAGNLLAGIVVGVVLVKSTPNRIMAFLPGFAKNRPKSACAVALDATGWDDFTKQERRVAQ